MSGVWGNSVLSEPMFEVQCCVLVPRCVSVWGAWV